MFAEKNPERATTRRLDIGTGGRDPQSPHPKRLLSAWSIPSAASVLILSCVLALSSGCAGSKSNQVSTPAASDQVRDTMHGAGGDYAISPDRQIRWAYTTMPTPEPSSKPNYLLKSYTCALSSAALNNEARGSLSDLVEILKAKPSIRVLALGLCDGEKEKFNAQNLGMNRAQGARQFLVAKGIAKNRIETATYGSSQATAPAGEKIGQSLERKVEVWLLTE